MQLILFKTHSEFEQENIDPGAAQEGVLAFAEPERNRMVLPIDMSEDKLHELITHELTHIFQYSLFFEGYIGAPPTVTVLSPDIAISLCAEAASCKPTLPDRDRALMRRLVATVLDNLGAPEEIARAAVEQEKQKKVLDDNLKAEMSKVIKQSKEAFVADR